MIDLILAFVKVGLVYISYRLYHTICFLLSSKLNFLCTTKDFIYRTNEILWPYKDIICNNNPLTIKGFPLMSILNRKSFNSEVNCLTVNSLFLECMIKLICEKLCSLYETWSNFLYKN